MQPLSWIFLLTNYFLLPCCSFPFRTEIDALGIWNMGKQLHIPCFSALQKAIYVCERRCWGIHLPSPSVPQIGFGLNARFVQVFVLYWNHKIGTFTSKVCVQVRMYFICEFTGLEFLESTKTWTKWALNGNISLWAYELTLPCNMLLSIPLPWWVGWRNERDL